MKKQPAQHFSQNIRTPMGDGIFYFNLRPLVSPRTYHVSIAHRHYGVVVFYMEAGEHGWELAREKDVPQWIIDLEPELSKAIVKHNT